uniref:Outer membrane protein beta-barrel domain-containing protein n=1 Tax=candidate division WOR-3 bacterium TaxID=2052148 RepID=A0A7V3ZX50_UNCW3
MKKLLGTVLLLFVLSQAHAGTWIGFGNYIPSPDTTYGILSALTPRVVAIRMGTNFKIEPSIMISYSRLSSNGYANIGAVDTFDIDQTMLTFMVKGIVPFVDLQKLSFYGFGGFGFGYGTEKTTYKETFGGITEGDYDKESVFEFLVPFGMGIQVNLSNNVSLALDFESGLSFSRISAEEKRGNTTTDLGSASLLNIALQNQVLRFILFFGIN